MRAAPRGVLGWQVLKSLEFGPAQLGPQAPRCLCRPRAYSSVVHEVEPGVRRTECVFFLSLSAPKEGRGRPGVEGAEEGCLARVAQGVPGPLGGPTVDSKPLLYQSSPALQRGGVAVEPKGRGEDFRGMPPAGEKKGERLPSGWGRLEVRTHRTSPRS